MSIAQILLSFPIWFLNGILSVLYWVGAHLAEIVSLLMGLLIAFGLAPQLQARATIRPRRYGRGEVYTTPPNASYLTIFSLVVWLVVSLNAQNPIPAIGAAMWVVAVLAILLVSEERVNQLWWANTGVLVYGVLVVIMQVGLNRLGQVNPAEWASVVGNSADAQLVLESTRGNLATIGMLLVIALYPLGYTGMLFNRFLRNPKPLYNVFTEADEILKRLRTRQ